MSHATNFPAYIEIWSLSVAQMVGLQTTAAFGYRYFTKHKAVINLTGLLASVLTLFFSTWAITLWFTGLGSISCMAIQVVNGLCLSSSNALAFVHLFLKADASNKLNPRWPVWRTAAIMSIIANWIILVVVHALITTKEAPNPNLGDEERCKWTFEEYTFKLKWLVQLFNHLLCVSLFVWPLLTHLQSLRTARHPRGSFTNGAATGALTTTGVTNDSVKLYKALVTRAVVAMIVSSAYCTLMTILAIIRYDNPTSLIPVFPLAVLDNACTLESIYFAIDLSGSAGAQQRLSISQLEAALAMSGSVNLSGTDQAEGAPKSTIVSAQV